MVKRHLLRVDLEVAAKDGRVLAADMKQDACPLVVVIQLASRDTLDPIPEPQRRRCIRAQGLLGCGRNAGINGLAEQMTQQK